MAIAKPVECRFFAIFEQGIIQKISELLERRKHEMGYLPVFKVCY
jgi:hypothetical protein